MPRKVDEAKMAQKIHDHIDKVLYLLFSYTEPADMSRVLSQAHLPPGIEKSLLAEARQRIEDISGIIREDISRITGGA